MSKLNNKNSNPTIPAIPWNKFHFIENLSNNYAGSLLNNISFRDENIRNNMRDLTNFINTLLHYISKVCSTLRHEFNKYMEDLDVENSSIEFMSEYKKVDSTYRQLIKKLENFSSDIAQDYNKVLQWAMELDLLKQRYAAIIREYNKLKNNHMHQESYSEQDFGRSSRRQHDLKTSLDFSAQKNKIVEQYNKKFADYNQFNTKITILASNISEGRIFYTPIFNSHRDYAISLKKFVDGFGKLVNVTDASTRKRGEVIAKLVDDYMDQLDKSTDTVNLNAVLKIQDITLDR